MTSLFTDVTMVSKYPFAVGYRMTANGSSQPIAARRDGKRWRYVSPRIRKRESMSLTGVAPDGRGGLWVVGHGGPGTEIGAVIFRRDNARWTRQKTPQLKGEAVLADVVASSGTTPGPWATSASAAARCPWCCTGTARPGPMLQRRPSNRTRSC